jgi:hypothetical protein
MMLPLFMLRKLHIRPIDKLGLAAVFLLALVDLIFDVVRTVTTLKVDSNVMESVEAMEPAVAVIVSAMAALGPAFRHHSHRQTSSSSLRWTSDHSQSRSRSHRDWAQKHEELARDWSSEEANIPSRA